MTPAIKCLILLAIVALLFVTEMIPLAAPTTNMPPKRTTVESASPKKIWFSGTSPKAQQATGIVPLEIAAVVGAVIAVLTGCLTEKQAYNSIDWVTIFLFAGMIPVATAMNTSGEGKNAWW